MSRSLDDNRAAVQHFVSVALGVPPDAWTRAPAAGKWSPAQVAEHVARTMDQAILIIEGRVTSPSLPRLLRPLARRFVLRPVLRSGRFIRGGKAPKAFVPSADGVPQAGVAAALERALVAYEECVARQRQAGHDEFEHPVFGRIPLVDYVRFNELHARHHEAQLPAGRS
ncbi:MAG TPA: DinB family protein [Gemmatimonadales bacterium]|nr:DinB family protein [Gemmatimonadales bacterium]